MTIRLALPRTTNSPAQSSEPVNPDVTPDDTPQLGQHRQRATLDSELPPLVPPVRVADGRLHVHIAQ